MKVGLRSSAAVTVTSSPTVETAASTSPSGGGLGELEEAVAVSHVRSGNGSTSSLVVLASTVEGAAPENRRAMKEGKRLIWSYCDYRTEDM